MKRALHVADSHGMVDKNVARLVTPPKVQRAEVVPLTPAQSTAFLEAVRGDRLEQLYQVAMATGLRQGELLGLRWEDVDLDAGVLRIRANLQRYDRAYHLDEVKTDKSRRSLAIAQPVVEALRRQRVRQAEDQLRTGPGWKGNAWNLVFTAEDGAPLYGGKVTRRLQAVLKVAGLPKVKFHDLRHGAASFLLAAGVDLKVVQDILGHSTIHTTANVYAHVAPKLRRDAAERIGEVLFSGGAESAAR